MSSSDNGDLTCQELVEVVTEYLEGTMTAADRACFERHIAGCRGCRNYLQQMRQTIGVLGRLNEETISDDARRELLDIFRDWNKGASVNRT